MIASLVEEEIVHDADHSLYRITIDHYLQMLAARVFTENDRLFLWRGRIVSKMTKGREHSKAATRLYKRLVNLVPEEWYVEQEQPMAIPDDGMPEPDLSVVRGTIDDYPDRAPSSSDVALVIEVADFSLSIDSGAVLRVYASESIPVYWILNIPNRWIEVHVKPSGRSQHPTYHERRIYSGEDEVPVDLDGREVGRIRVREIFPEI